MAGYSNEQLQALKDALARGVTSVNFGERTITYRSVEELKAAISVVEMEMAKSSGTVTRQVRVYTGSGFNRPNPPGEPNPF